MVASDCELARQVQVVPEARALIRAHSDAELPAEGYSLQVAAKAVDIRHADAQGLRHALRTLAQLEGDGSWPRCLIEDAPLYPIRGLMLDCARDRVPRMQEVARLIDLLARLKANQLQLYSEHNIAYRGHRPVWQNASPFTLAELRQIDGWCSERGIVLVANQNCFGHMQRWLIHEEYAGLGNLADTAARLRDPSQWGRFSLNPAEPRCLDFVRGLLDQLLPCFKNRMVNIGCDEVCDLGEGGSQALVERLGAAKVYGSFVGAVSRHCLQHGYRPQFWADMALSMPTALQEVPGEAVALAWGYERDADFKKWGEALAADGRSWLACPGTASWQSIHGRQDARRGSISSACTSGADGILLTDWGDRGHQQQWPVAALGYGEGLGAAWSGACWDLPALSRTVFGDDSGRVAQYLDEFSQLDQDLRGSAPGPRGGQLRNASLLFAELFLRDGEWLPQPRLWQLLRERLNDLRRQLPAVEDPLLGAELAHGQEIAELAAETACQRRGVGRQTPAQLRQAWQQALAEFGRLWNLRSRPGGREESLTRYQEAIGLAV